MFNIRQRAHYAIHINMIIAIIFPILISSLYLSPSLFSPTDLNKEKKNYQNL